MNERLIDILACPSCKGSLQLIAFGNTTCVDAEARQEVISGLLKCTCGNLYPVIEGVPCFVKGGAGQSAQIMEQHRQQPERNA